ncbi:hypothetical protein BpHYR1_042560 [Brachionus plicatilis]|uniref:Uncharacterized protein n=1 Tax=Brachionus plicatilis TaxID=10195 RepID=A0A3M7SBQ4_BRAPC|nr:hypothetical protein BpHYR1_042560 [Brachionus plicatilis]
MKIAADVATSYLKTVLCQKKELDLDVYADRVSAIEALVGTRVQIGEVKVNIKNCSQTFMVQLHHLLNLDTVDLNVKLLIFFFNSISYGNLKNDPCGLKYLCDTDI